MKRAVFFDRDGVLNEVVTRGGRPESPRTLEEFKLVSGVADAVSKIKSMGFVTVVVTNQPDVARGMLDEDVLAKLHAVLKSELPVDDIRCCPHDDGSECDCRKPLPGMLLAAAADLEIDLGSSYLIGDGRKDMEAGTKAGCTTILINASYNQDVGADHRVRDIGEVVELIRTLEKGR